MKLSKKQLRRVRASIRIFNSMSTNESFQFFRYMRADISWGFQAERDKADALKRGGPVITTLVNTFINLGFIPTEIKKHVDVACSNRRS